MELSGRVTSQLITRSVGFVPVSMFVADAAMQVSLDATMIVAGCGFALLAGGSLLSPPVRNLGLEPVAGSASVA
ncbi:MAG: hypothetical protein HYX55_09160 [Chloroflexi bacterium]|nr:hypothetical protein [Chloroflexota bacterium]